MGDLRREDGGREVLYPGPCRGSLGTVGGKFSTAWGGLGGWLGVEHEREGDEG